MQGVFASGRLTAAPLRDHVAISDSEDSDESYLNKPFNSTQKSVRINVGGTVFETQERTLKKIPNSRLSRLTPRSIYFRPDKGEYFFDRDPEIFRSILNYHRIGELHLPLHLCGPLLERELQYWRIPEQIVEKCCWIHYIQLRSQKYSLVDFESFFADPTLPRADNKWRRWANKIWIILNRPSSSNIALFYAIIVALFVFLSIFVFVAETHPAFQEITTPNAPSKSQNSSLTDNNNQTLAYAAKLTLKDSMRHSRGTSKYIEKSELSEGKKQKWVGLEYIDYVCIVFFTFDLLLRIAIAPNRSQFIVNPMTIIEVTAVLPYYIDIIAHFISNLLGLEMQSFIDVIHILRIFGVLRILKILRYYSGLQVLVYTVRSSYKDLLLMLTFIGVATLFFSSLIYYVDDQDTFISIPTGFWWAIITMTTVGYGDVYPTKTGGYIIGSMCALVGVLVVAFTVPILVNSFMLYYSHAQSIQSYKEDGRLQINNDNERAYLDYTFNTLKRLSFHSLFPKMPDLWLKRDPTNENKPQPGDKQSIAGDDKSNDSIEMIDQSTKDDELLSESHELIINSPVTNNRNPWTLPIPLSKNTDLKTPLSPLTLSMPLCSHAHGSGVSCSCSMPQSDLPIVNAVYLSHTSGITLTSSRNSTTTSAHAQQQDENEPIYKKVNGKLSCV